MHRVLQFLNKLASICGFGFFVGAPFIHTARRPLCAVDMGLLRRCVKAADGRLPGSLRLEGPLPDCLRACARPPPMVQHIFSNRATTSERNRAWACTICTRWSG